MNAHHIETLKELFPYIVIAVLIIKMAVPRKEKQEEQKFWDNYYSTLELINEYPYYKQPILSNRLLKEYRILKKYTDENDLLVIPKIPLKTLLSPETETMQKELLEFKISSGTVDFCICNKNLDVVLIIYIDQDNSAKNNALKNILENMLSGAGYRVIFVPQITDDVLNVIISDSPNHNNELTFEEWKAQQGKEDNSAP